MTAKNTLFVFGFGYTARILAELLSPLGWKISGTSRNVRQCEQYAVLGYDIREINPDSVSDLMSTATHVLSSVPPLREGGDPIINEYQQTLLEAAPRLQWLGYLSSTGVYGDHQGAIVTEETVPQPNTDSGKNRLAAEKLWLDLGRKAKIPTQIFRLSGIYGPKRNALCQLLEGSAQCIEKPGHFFSRIHVADIAKILLASLNNPHEAEIYNVSDDEPCVSCEVIEYAAKLLGHFAPERIPFEEATLSPMAQEFWKSNRRVSNEKVKRQLGITLEYPSFREGLESLFKNHLD